MIHQISFFDEQPLSWFEQSLLRGSLLAGGKYRIYGASLHLSVTDFAKFLKEEYGTGGCSVDEGFLDFGSSGVKLWKIYTRYEEEYSWTDTAKAIKRLISIDRYLTDKDKEYIKKLQEAHGGTIPLPNPCYGYGNGWA